MEYNQQLEIARRWDACVDFGSLMSTWSPAMWAEYRKAQEEHRAPNMKNTIKKGN